MSSGSAFDDLLEFDAMAFRAKEGLRWTETARVGGEMPAYLFSASSAECGLHPGHMELCVTY